jgi:hypothetical protein
MSTESFVENGVRGVNYLFSYSSHKTQFFLSRISDASFVEKLTSQDCLKSAFFGDPNNEMCMCGLVHINPHKVLADHTSRKSNLRVLQALQKSTENDQEILVFDRPRRDRKWYEDDQGFLRGLIPRGPMRPFCL